MPPSADPVAEGESLDEAGTAGGVGRNRDGFGGGGRRRREDRFRRGGRCGRCNRFRLRADFRVRGGSRGGRHFGGRAGLRAQGPGGGACRDIEFDGDRGAAGGPFHLNGALEPAGARRIGGHVESVRGQGAPDPVVGRPKRAGSRDGRPRQPDPLRGHGRARPNPAEAHPVRVGPDGRARRRRGRGLRDVADVVHQPGQGRVGARGGGEVVALQPGLQLADRAEPGVHVLVGQGRLQVGGQRRGLDAPSLAAGQVELTLHVDLAARGLVRVPVADRVEHVLVQLVEGDPAVLVAVRVPAGQALGERRGEQRRPSPLIIGELLAFERVLHGRRGSDDRPAAPAAGPVGGEAVQHVDVAGRPDRDTLGEGATVAAVQQQHDGPGAAGPHTALHEIGGHRGRTEPVGPGVRGREKQFARIALQPVTGEMEQQHVVGAAFRQ